MAGAPESEFRSAAQAQLVLASLLLCLLPMILLLRPPQPHAVKIDLPFLPEQGLPLFHPKLLAMTSIILPEPPPNIAAAGDTVPVEVTQEGRILIAGAPVDLVQLRANLDHVTLGDQWIDLRPHPEARYEQFLEVLAVIRRAGVHRLHLDHIPFNEAVDGGRGGGRRS